MEPTSAKEMQELEADIEGFKEGGAVFAYLVYSFLGAIGLSHFGGLYGWKGIVGVIATLVVMHHLFGNRWSKWKS